MYRRIRKTTKDEAYYREFIKARVVVDARGCWLWQGFVGPPPNEYGQCYALGRNWRVHRLAYMLWKGAPDPELDVCHECDVKHCCNPDHLWQGTPKANMQDAAEKRIWSRQHKTHCLRGHELVPPNLYYAPGTPNKRRCRACERLRAQSPHTVEWRRQYQRNRRAAQKRPASQL